MPEPTFSDGLREADLSWRDEAECRLVPEADEIFFPAGTNSIILLTKLIRAQEVCRRCPVVQPCLAGAMARKEKEGVWGGQLFKNGRPFYGHLSKTRFSEAQEQAERYHGVTPQIGEQAS